MWRVTAGEVDTQETEAEIETETETETAGTSLTRCRLYVRYA
jgi:hypothetical protein